MGWIVENNTARQCKCFEGKVYKEILEKCGISETFLKKTFDNYIPKNKRTKEAKEAAIKYAEEFQNIRNTRHNSIAFIGQVGSGKTHLSIAIANKLMQQGTGIRYMPYRDIIIQLKQNVVDEENYQREINKYKMAPVLLLDDLFKGKITEADINATYEILNYRYIKALPLIISSEHNTDKLLSIDEAIGSRIIEMCKGRVIEFVGKDLNYRLG